MPRPRNDDHDLELMAAWLYYVHGLGQEQVARSLDVSRTKVARLLSRARETGLVKITLDHELAETLALSEWIAKRYGVERFIVTPPTNVAVTDRDLAEQIGRQSVGIVGSNLLIRRVNNSGGRINIGVGGGRTLRHVVDCLPRQPATGVKVTALAGTTNTDDGSGIYNIAQALADALGGEAYTLPAPIFLSRKETRDMLAQDPVLGEVLALGGSTDLNILGCGPVSAESSFGRATRLSQRDLDEARQAGAVGEIAGILLDKEGRLAETSLHARRMGVSLEDLRRGDTIVIAAGQRKVAALKAVIRAKLARTIIVDQEIATELVADASKKSLAAE